MDSIPIDRWVEDRAHRQHCAWGCYHDNPLFTFHKTKTGEIFEHDNLEALYEWLRECYDVPQFELQMVRDAMLDCLKQSAADHDVGAEAVSVLHVEVRDETNEWGDLIWVRTQYRWSRKKEFGPIPENDDDEWEFEWVDCPPTTSLADYGWNGLNKANCYAD